MLPSHSKVRKLSLPLFVIVNTLTLAGFLFLVALVAPTVWQNQVSTSWWSLTLTFLIVHLVNAFAEFFFHRYMLHAPIVPGMARLYRQHDLIHHRITEIGLNMTNRQAPTVRNHYPIVEEHQHEASFFPWYSFMGFAAFATPFFALAQWLIPTVPIFLGGYLAIAWSMFLYEIWHMIEHWPYESWWKPRMKNPRWGWFWKKAYLFHVRHHADTKCNEAISGFFTLPVADWVFGTHVKAHISYEHGTPGKPEDFKPPKPRRMIVLLDKFATSAIQTYRVRNN